MKNKKLLLIFIILFAVFMIPAIILNLVSYNDFCLFILTRSGKLHKLAEFQSQFLTQNKFIFIRVAASILPIGIAIIFFLINKNLVLIQKKIKDFYSEIKHPFIVMKRGVTDLSQIEKLIAAFLFAVYSIRTFYHTITLPIHVDEAFTYLNYVSQDVPVAMSYYTTNNHILYSLLGNISYHLPFSSLFNLRLPTLLITFACCFLFFIFIRLIYNFLTALVSTSILVSLYPFAYYSISARGYLLITFLFAICCFALISIIKTGKREFWVIYSIASILGAYTIPSFLYPFLSLSIFAIYYFFISKSYNEIKNLIYSSLFVGTVVITLYLPVFVINGLSSVTSNPYVHPVERIIVLKELPKYIFDLNNWFFGEIYIGLILLLMSFFFYRNQNNLIRRLSAFCFLAVPILCIVHSVLPFERVWTYLVIVVGLISAISIEKLTSKFNLNVWSVSLICLAVLVLGEFSYVRRIETQEIRAEKSSHYINYLQDKHLTNFYIEEDLTSTYIAYYLKIANRSYKIHNGLVESFDLNQNYDCIILKSDNLNTLELEAYNLIYSDEISKIFVKSIKN